MISSKIKMAIWLISDSVSVVLIGALISYGVPPHSYKTAYHGLNINANSIIDLNTITGLDPVEEYLKCNERILDIHPINLTSNKEDLSDIDAYADTSDKFLADGYTKDNKSLSIH